MFLLLSMNLNDGDTVKLFFQHGLIKLQKLLQLSFAAAERAFSLLNASFGA